MSKISERAMLVNLNIRVWSGRKYDPSASKEVADTHNTQIEKAGRFNKMLVNTAALRPASNAAATARLYHASVTMPWLGDGARIMPVDVYFDYTQAMNNFRSIFNKEVDDFVAQYPTHMAQAALDLNGLYQQSDYPTAISLRNKYSFDCKVYNVPDAQDFRVKMSSDEFEEAKRQITENYDAVINGTVTDLFERIKFRMELLVKRIKEVEADEKGRLKSSLIERISDLAELLPKMNITNSKVIDDIAEKMTREFKSIDMGDLREVQSVRDAAVTSAEEIIKTVRDYI